MLRGAALIMNININPVIRAGAFHRRRDGPFTINSTSFQVRFTLFHSYSSLHAAVQALCPQSDPQGVWHTLAATLGPSVHLLAIIKEVDASNVTYHDSARYQESTS